MKNKVKELREEMNISQELLAQKLNISRQSVISIEKSKYKPSLVLAFKFSKIFGKKIEEIFFPTDEELN